MEQDAMIQDVLQMNSPMRMVTATHVHQEPSEVHQEDHVSGPTGPCLKPIQLRLSLMKRRQRNSTWTRSRIWNPSAKSLIHEHI